MTCGRRAAEAALRSGNLRELWVVRGSAHAGLVAAARASRSKVKVRECGDKRLAVLAGTNRHSGIVSIVAACDVRGWRRAAAAKAAPLIVVFEHVQDAGNLGACLRSAAAFGIDAALRSARRSAGLTPAVARVASGGAEHVALGEVSNIARELRAMRDAGLHVVGADPAATKTIYAADLRGPLVWVFGGEQHGLRLLTQKQCDELLRVPMPGAENIASLNISVAFGICMAETCRQRDER